MVLPSSCSGTPNTSSKLLDGMSGVVALGCRLTQEAPVMIAKMHIENVSFRL